MHIFTLEDVDIHQIINRALAFKKREKLSLENKIVATLFFEPSTRTRYSFEVAALNLNCKTINFESSNSSLNKGETLYDTIQTFAAFNIDAMIIRHPENNYYEELKKIKIPIINGGDGTNNHLSQSLLDLMTIYEEFGYYEGLKILMVGDIKHSRVAHTNMKIMRELGMKVYLSGPKEFEDQETNFEFEEMIQKVDIIMMLRIQKERHHSLMNLSNEEYHLQYGLTMQRLNKTKSHTIVMHPGPFNRNIEIADEVIEHPKSRIFKQIENGVYVRMALLEKVLSR